MFWVSARIKVISLFEMVVSVEGLALGRRARYSNNSSPVCTDNSMGV